MTQPVRYVLRDLPGVAALEAMLERIQAHPNPLWAPENDQVVEKAEAVARQLFGVSHQEVDFIPEQAKGPLRPGEPVWQRSIWMGDEDDEASPYADDPSDWDDYGWDVRSADGKELLSLAFLDWFIVLATEGKAGRLPDAPKSDAEIERAAAAFEAQLAAEADKFKRSHRR